MLKRGREDGGGGDDASNGKRRVINIGGRGDDEGESDTPISSAAEEGLVSFYYSFYLFLNSIFFLIIYLFVDCSFTTS